MSFYVIVETRYGQESERVDTPAMALVVAAEFAAQGLRSISFRDEYRSYTEDELQELASVHAHFARDRRGGTPDPQPTQ